MSLTETPKRKRSTKDCAKFRTFLTSVWIRLEFVYEGRINVGSKRLWETRGGYTEMSCRFFITSKEMTRLKDPSLKRTCKTLVTDMFSTGEFVFESLLGLNLSKSKIFLSVMEIKERWSFVKETVLEKTLIFEGFSNDVEP